MNSKAIALIFICFGLLSVCISAIATRSEPSKYGSDSGVIVQTKQAEVLQAASKPSRSILELYENWNGRLICNQQSYASGSTVYFSDEFVECEMQLNFEQGLNTTTDDLRILEQQYISVENETVNDSDRFDYIDFFASAARPNLIQFRLGPSKQRLKLLFKTNAVHEPKTFYFEFNEPLTYTIERPFNADGKSDDTGVRHYLQTGESHIYNIAFSQAVDQNAVERIIDHQLAGIEKRIKWPSDRSLTLTLQLEAANLTDFYEQYELNFIGVKTVKGVANWNWRENPSLRFQPANRKQYYKHNVLNGSEQPLFSSLIAYSSLEASPNGKWILAEELSSEQSVFVTNYSLLDSNGKRLKELRMKSPKWLPDGDSLLYTEHNSVMRYEIPTGEKHVVWTDAKETAIMSYQYDRVSGRLLVAAGHYDGKGGVPVDLYLFETVSDSKPRLFQNVLYNQKDIAWSGLHYTLPVSFIDRGLLYLESALPADEQKDEYPIVRTVMDWESGQSRSLDLKGELYSISKGKMLHGENGKWSVYDAVSGRETPLNFHVSHGEGLALKAIREGMIVLSVSDAANAKHYILDVDALSLRQIPGSLNILSGGTWSGEVVTVK